MNPENFHFGIGVGTIPSVDSPHIIMGGQTGYPVAESTMPVFGVDHDGEQRAYRVSDLTSYEVFNDVYPRSSDRYVAVTY